MMEYLHSQICALIVSRRSALTQNQIEKGIIGYKSRLIEQAINEMLVDQAIQPMKMGAQTFYQLTLAGWTAYAEYQEGKGAE